MSFTTSSIFGFIGGFIASVAVSMIRAPKRLRRLSANRPVTTISPSPEEGVIIPYSMVHELVKKGTDTGGMLLTIKENVDDDIDPEFVIKFVGMKKRE